MRPDDLPELIESRTPSRLVTVDLSPSHVAPEDFTGTVAVVVDQLRASVTITAALASGAPYVLPVMTVAQAQQVADDLRARGVPALLGGERGGTRVPGFDLANTPAEYTPEAVAGRPVVFTTTNGTAALLLARPAERVLVGSLANMSRIIAELAEHRLPVRILCAGGRGEVSGEDVLAAGALVAGLIAAGRNLGRDDSARLALALWHATAPESLAPAMAGYCGGRSLIRLGLQDDIQWCAQCDRLPVLPEYDPTTGQVRLA